MKVETTEFKKILLTALKGASYNTFLPITCFCAIRETRDRFSISTTDGVNILTVYGNTMSDALPHTLLDCVIDVKTLASLVNKITSDTISFTLSGGDTLNVTANGRYSFTLPLDENNRPIAFPASVDVVNNADRIYADNIREVIKTNKAALSKTNECPELGGYYFSDTVITTDSLIICENVVRVFNEDVMFAPSVVDILALFTDVVEVAHEDNYYVFSDEHIRYSAYSSEYQDAYPIEAIIGLTKTGFPYHGVVNSKELYNALDRTALFISPYDANSCSIQFSAEGMIVTNQDESCAEIIDIAYDGDITETVIKINVNFLMSQLKTMQDKVIISFGNSRCISLEDEITTRIIALQGA